MKVFAGLGGSITHGVRDGVLLGQEFLSLLAARLASDGVPNRFHNWGFDGATSWPVEGKLTRPRANLPIDAALLMYEKNDSAAYDVLQPKPQTSLDDSAAAIAGLIFSLRALGIVPILMTSPRYAPLAIGYAQTDAFRLPWNFMQERYVLSDRATAAKLGVPLVDHWQDWTDAERAGQSLQALTTDGCHPNPAGHRRMADLIYPVLRQAVS